MSDPTKQQCSHCGEQKTLVVRFWQALPNRYLRIERKVLIILCKECVAHLHRSLSHPGPRFHA